MGQAQDVRRCPTHKNIPNYFMPHYNTHTTLADTPVLVSAGKTDTELAGVLRVLQPSEDIE
jgi:hypothetical protein